MSKRDLSQEQKSVPYINVTPLIDVLLVLLIIFMVVTPQKPSRFKAMIPDPPPNIGKPNPLALVVTIDKDLRLRLNGLSDDLGSVSDTSKLSEALSTLFQKRREAGTYRTDVANLMDLPEDERTVKTVFIKAPRSIQYGAVARVIDGVKGAGAQPIGLQIDDLN